MNKSLRLKVRKLETQIKELEEERDGAEEWVARAKESNLQIEHNERLRKQLTQALKMIKRLDVKLHEANLLQGKQDDEERLVNMMRAIERELHIANEHEQEWRQIKQQKMAEADE